MAQIKPLTALSFQTIVQNPRCVAAAYKLIPKYRHLILSWLAAHDLLVDPNYLDALDSLLNAQPPQWADLDCGEAVNCESLNRLSLHCHNLQWLSLKCDFFALGLDNGIKALLGTLKQVRYVKLGGALRIENSGTLSALKSPFLETLIVELWIISDETFDLEIVVHNNPSIRVFSLWNAFSQTTPHDALVRKISDKLSMNLTELKLTQVKIGKEALSCLLLSCTELQTLALAGELEFDPETMLRIAVECKWKELELELPCWQDETAFEALKHLPSTITSLSLEFYSDLILPSVDLTLISKSIMLLPNLCKFRYHTECDRIGLLTEQLFCQIGPKLSSLDIGLQLPQHLANRVLTAIADHCRNLESFKIRYDTGSAEMPLLRIVQIPARAAKIRVLSFFNTPSNDFVEILIRNCINLEELQLTGKSSINDDLLILLARTCLKLRVLNITGSLVTDRGVLALLEHLPLTSLNLSRCHRLTDAALLALEQNSTRLEYFLCTDMSLSRCPFTKEAIKRLKLACHKRSTGCDFLLSDAFNSRTVSFEIF